MDFTLRVWRQRNCNSEGKFVDYKAANITPDMSFLEMLDLVNLQLAKNGEDVISFDHDCREGICGTCGLYINGRAHGPLRGVATCQLYMRSFSDTNLIVIEPWRAKAFPVIKDLVVDRGAFDRIIQSGGYVSVHTGGVPDGNTILVPKKDADTAMDASECIGCGACVAACPNGSAMLFTAAKVTHLAVLPQGRPEAARRVCVMTEEMLNQGFGNCGNHYECQAVCPKGIKVQFIAKLNREFIKASIL
jgi:succinate dehydrogenase / fumarate reductase iron-sulfur subunit